MQNAVTIRDLKFHYPKSTQLILDLPELNIPMGAKWFLRAPSGSGKSTLLHLIQGTQAIHTHQCKTFSVLENNWLIERAHRKDFIRGRSMGVIFQNLNLIPYLTGFENIMLIKKLFPQQFNEDWTSNAIHSLGIESCMKRKAHLLSRGEAQRVAAVRALCHHPQLVLADEPTSALGESHQLSIFKIINQLHQTKPFSLILVSHETQQSLSRFIQFDHVLELSSPEQGNSNA